MNLCRCHFVLFFAFFFLWIVSFWNGGIFTEEKNEKSTLDLLWMAPFVSGGGYSSEALSYVLSLKKLDPNRRIRIHQHGDGINLDFWNGLVEESRNLLELLFSQPIDMKSTIVICHSEPGAWFPPLFQTQPCPPFGYGKGKSSFVIGRTMFETDRLDKEHSNRCNKMDEIWVPSSFHVKTFSESGVERRKIFVIPQAVDVDFFNPEKVKAMTLPEGKVIGKQIKNYFELKNSSFVFLSVFKWELRKGWDILLEAYFTEFHHLEDVNLCVLTNPYHENVDISSVVEEYVRKINGSNSPLDWPRMTIIDQHVPQQDLPGLYKSADSFVLPTRGEGWGRPIVEAMAMELPVIVTNWSGMTEYLTEENSFSIPIEGLSPVEKGHFKDHMWAKPSISELRRLMRLVFEDKDERRRRGLRAREDMVEKYNPSVIASKVLDRLRSIESELQNGHQDEL